MKVPDILKIGGIYRYAHGEASKRFRYTENSGFHVLHGAAYEGARDFFTGACLYMTVIASIDDPKNTLSSAIMVGSLHIIGSYGLKYMATGHAYWNQYSLKDLEGIVKEEITDIHK